MPADPRNLMPASRQYWRRLSCLQIAVWNDLLEGTFAKDLIKINTEKSEGDVCYHSFSSNERLNGEKGRLRRGDDHIVLYEIGMQRPGQPGRCRTFPSNAEKVSKACGPLYKKVKSLG
ncbi:hypothetical protein Naga_100098g6 [Nannochloropsis gaditana]|uniref:Uncharacterized protein n=1 Tax=Nannochloropsis gaditana TaxID=72520 RepID=W7TWQ9_9STRA|nr:hypothetical protein Naga_100098g6 [Nannochloropsis gaditana]